MVRIPSLSRRRETAPVRDENQDGRIDERDADLAAHQSDPGRDGRPAAPTSPAVGAEPSPPPVVTDRSEDHTTYRSRSADEADDRGDATANDGRADTRTDAERRAADRAATARAATGRTGTHPVVTRAPAEDRTDERVVPAAGSARTDEDLDRTVDNRTADPDPERTEPDVRPRPEDRTDVVVDRGPRPRTSLLATASLIFGVAGALFVLTGTLAGYGMVLGGVAALLGVAGLSATRRRHIAGTTEAMTGMLLGLAAVVIGILAMTGQFGWPSTDDNWVQRFREWLDAQFVDRF
ncbi:DUF308 domain-containing protein [Plantactinospora sp. GCM10030261]|uniref:DUF308 domain-containing protein n=1 Tax=Plantactinospora sp. GCM10030261 TaxID=3273420 RepID=UPI00361D7E62